MSHLLPFLPASWAQALAGYPDWLVITVALVVVLALLWILGKLIKWALYLLLIVLLLGRDRRRPAVDGLAGHVRGAGGPRLPAERAGGVFLARRLALF